MFKKFLTIVGTYSFCVFIYKLNRDVSQAAGPLILDALDEIKKTK